MKCMHLIRYVRLGVSWHDDLDIELLLTRNLQNQELPVVNIKYHLKGLTMVNISRSTVTIVYVRDDHGYVPFVVVKSRLFLAQHE